MQWGWMKQKAVSLTMMEAKLLGLTESRKEVTLISSILQELQPVKIFEILYDKAAVHYVKSPTEDNHNK